MSISITIARHPLHEAATASALAGSQAHVLALDFRTRALVGSCLADAILFRMQRGQKDLQQAEARLKQGKPIHHAARFRLYADATALFAFRNNAGTLDVTLSEDEDTALGTWETRLGEAMEADHTILDAAPQPQQVAA